MNLVAVLFFASVLLTSCSGNSIENDAKKAATLQCEVNESRIKSLKGEEGAADKLKKKEKELDELKKTTGEKYKSYAERKEFIEKMMTELKQNCKIK